jgi:uncharacterized membrane-anchored protein
VTIARRNLWLRVAIVALAQAVVLGWMIWDRVHLLSSGREIVLEVIPVDPRSLFRGDYVTLGYDISRIQVPGTEKRLRRGEAVYVTLQKSGDGKWQLAGTSPRPPEHTAPDQVVLKGSVQYQSAATDRTPAEMGVRYGIETFFVPEGAGRQLEKLVGDKKFAALIAVDEEGNAGIKGLVAEGKRVYEEPLL